jgi:hypothetical protein
LSRLGRSLFRGGALLLLPSCDPFHSVLSHSNSHSKRRFHAYAYAIAIGMSIFVDKDKLILPSKGGPHGLIIQTQPLRIDGHKPDRPPASDNLPDTGNAIAQDKHRHRVPIRLDPGPAGHTKMLPIVLHLDDVAAAAGAAVLVAEFLGAAGQREQQGAEQGGRLRRGRRGRRGWGLGVVEELGGALLGD